MLSGLSILVAHKGWFMDLLFVTNNKAKIKIVNAILRKHNIKIKTRSFDFRELQDINVENVSRDKANQFLEYNKVKEPFLVMDSGLYISALKGFPGAILRPSLDTIGDVGICKLLIDFDNRSADFVHSFAMWNQRTKETKTFILSEMGKIINTPVGSKNLGWGIERIFIPNGSKKCFSQFSTYELREYWSTKLRSSQYNRFADWVKSQL